MRIAPTAAALLAVLALAACSSSSNGDPTTGPSTPTVTTPGATTPTSPPAPPSSSSQAPSSTGLTEAQAKTALLTAAEVGGGFTQITGDDTDTPLPCTPNEPALDQQFPPNVKVQSDFSGLSGKAAFSEEIETFAGAATVAKVIAGGEKGLACGTATVSGTKVAITGPTDLTGQLGTPVDKSEAWTITSPSLNAALIVAQLGQHLVVFSFGAAPTVQSTSLPDSQKIVNAALAKVAAALK